MRAKNRLVWGIGLCCPAAMLVIMVETTLLILILFTNPAVEKDAQSFARKLDAYASIAVNIEIGKQAQKNLQEMGGISSSDLIAAGGIGKTLTKQQPRVLIIHLDRKEMKGDIVAEVRMWFDGRDENFVSIAGNGGDPVPSLVAGVGRMLDYKLRPSNSSAGQVGNNRGVPLSELVKQKAWAQLLGRIAEIKPEDRAPVQLYYQIMAYVQMSDRNEAVRNLNIFREKYPKHLLVTSAEALIPSRKMSDAELLGIGSDHSIDPLAEPVGNEEVAAPVTDKKKTLAPELKKDPAVQGPPVPQE